METNDFKYKNGDIVIVYKENWCDYSLKQEKICIIIECFADRRDSSKWYRLCPCLDGYSVYDIEHNAMDETIRPLTEYWYINEDFKPCIETDVKLNSKFLHRAKSFGIYQTESEASFAIWLFQRNNRLCQYYIK